MNIKLQAQLIEEEVVHRNYSDISSDTGHDFSALKAVNDAAVSEASDTRQKKPVVMLKNIGLFFAAPFIALAYVVALPFVGVYMFSKLAIEAKAQKG